jgi:hypothetical protein
MLPSSAALALKEAGFTKISNLTGGILAWAEKEIRRCQSTDDNQRRLGLANSLELRASQEKHPTCRY